MDLKLLNTNKPVSSYVKSIVVVLFHVINGFVDTTMSARKCTEFLTSIYQNQICGRHVHFHGSIDHGHFLTSTYQNQIYVQRVHVDVSIGCHDYFLTTTYQNQVCVLHVHIHGSIDRGHFLNATYQNQVCVLHVHPM